MPKNNLFKFIPALIIASAILAVGFGAGLALAQSTSTVTLMPPINSASGGGATLEDIIKNVTGFIFWLGITICPILIVWGGFNIATAGDDENKVTQGKQIITYAAVGLVIIALSNAMVITVQKILATP